MEQKNIFIEPNEEIVSIIDRLAQDKGKEIGLVIPRGAQVWQSSINLKLLKREADILGKDVTLIVTDSLEKEAAENVGFKVRRENDFPIELAQAKPTEKKREPKAIKVKTLTSPKERLGKNKENMIGLLVEEMESDKEKDKINSSLNKEEDEVVTQLVQKKSPSGLDRFVPLKNKSIDVFSLKKPKKKSMDIVDPEDVKVNFFRRRILGEKFLSKKKIPQERIEPQPRQEDIIPPRMEPVRVEHEGRRLKWSKIFILFIILAVVISGTVTYLVLPSTEITITPKVEKKSFDLSLIGTVSISRIDEILNRLPLQEVKVVKSNSQEFLATGEKQLDEKAKGTITVYNEYSSSDQTLVATTRFESPDGKIFRIPKTITVPGAKIEEGRIIASSIDVEVIADQPGDDYNIGPADFTIPGFKGGPKFASFYGKSKESMSGGSIEKVKVVLAEDLEQAEKILIEQLKGEVSQALEEQIPSDLKILEGGLKEEIADITSTAKEDDQADKFNLGIDMVIRALLYREEDLKDLIDLNLIAQITEEKRPLSDTQKIKWQEPIIDWEKGEVSFSLEIEEDLAFKIDTDKLKSNLVGKEEVEVRKYLTSQPEIEKAKVTFWPFWANRIPKQEKKIKITVE